MLPLNCSYSGRGGGTRTPGLLLPKQVRYQLRYSPVARRHWPRSAQMLPRPWLARPREREALADPEDVLQGQLVQVLDVDFAAAGAHGVEVLERA
jgi:hypothetical protein